ncbi:Na+/H+ antiporter subunit E [Alkalibacter mobilis]|uniref:Na+/H+ antiporter subunit E n=1 Tax=Alkalibacter mobilis TaxID=2787712 RepID=UPI00189F7005|nr:Na+/H+ antiporter subunit E [Alkalibacter mobilis]MBF7097082.1 Na+/H+ antiporter subunit E [Alkalibacter mobilis]
MKKITGYFSMIFIFTLIWIILNEKAGATQIVTGLILSIFSIFFANYYLLEEEYVDHYSLNIKSVIKYLVYLIFQIYKSGFSAIGKIIKKEYDVRISEYTSCLNDELSICLLANAITLTPGTVTIDKNGSKLKILSFEKDNIGTIAIDSETCSEFEKILGGIRE